LAGFRLKLYGILNALNVRHERPFVVVLINS